MQRVANSSQGLLLAAAAGIAALASGCASVPLPAVLHRPSAPATAATHPKVDAPLPALPAAASGRGGYYQDDGPGEHPPADLADVPDAQVKIEPYSKYANRPYVVFGKTYTPMLSDAPFVQRGMASWYGKKFHNQRTSSGELYDMYKMTAAHPTLPIPSYARVTSVASGKQVVVRINDRGPFHASRVIDVSYTAALKLGLLASGSHQVEVERLLPGDIARMASARRDAAEVAAAAPAPQDEPAPDAAAAGGAQDTVKPGYYLQLGAYGRADKAAQVQAQLAQLGRKFGTLEVVQAGSVHRLFGGPFETRAQADQAAKLLPAGFSLKPLVVRR